MYNRTQRIFTTAIPLIAIAMLVGCGPRARQRNLPPDIRRVTGVGVMSVAPAPAPAPVYTPPPAPPQQVIISGVSSADGYGVPNPGLSAAQGKLMAKRAAMSDARRNLLEQLKGVSVDSNTTVANFMTQSDVIRTQVNGYLQNAIIVDEGQESDGTYFVRMQIDNSGLGTIINSSMPAQPMSAPPPASAAPVATGGPQQAQARAMGRRAAKMDAQRQLLEMAKGVYIDSSTTVQDFIARDDRMRSRIEGIIRGAQETDVRYLPDGTVEVDMQFDMNQVRYNVR